MGQKIDSDKLVNSAQQAFRLAPSVNTRNTLIKALLLRTSERFSQSNQAYRNMVDRSLRGLSHMELLVIALDKQIIEAASANSDRDFKQALALTKESNEKFPQSPDVEDWMLFRHTDPAYAEIMEKRLAGDKKRLYDNIFIEKFNTTSVSSLYNLAWTHELDGKPEAAKQLLAQGASMGLPMPLPASKQP